MKISDIHKGASDSLTERIKEKLPSARDITYDKPGTIPENIFPSQFKYTFTNISFVDPSQEYEKNSPFGLKRYNPQYNARDIFTPGLTEDFDFSIKNSLFDNIPIGTNQNPPEINDYWVIKEAIIRD